MEQAVEAAVGVGTRQATFECGSQCIVVALHEEIQRRRVAQEEVRLQREVVARTVRELIADLQHERGT